MPVILNSKPQMIISSFDQFLEYLSIEDDILVKIHNA